ncbi:uncharacterized protein LOC141777738 [Sebastes fasciatus]|uniref:uncharacterized protein LOC141777738 n=1 Tax=Sebastes fasciatus TaxID=394691 RepID=UPI003D9F4CDD
MLRERSLRPSQAAQQNTAGNIVVCGTGYCYKVEKWPISSFTGRKHKLVMPPDSPDKKFVLLVGCSHLRAIADGNVKMPEGLSFGIMSTPGACAAELRTEVMNSVVPRTPDVVCLLAPSNDLEASRTIDEAGVAFGKLLYSVCSLWPQVMVLDFPPRLNVAVDLQDQLRQEFHRVAARAGVKYVSTAEHFPVHNLKLWSQDGVHLSDSEGMGILAKLFWTSAHLHLETTAPKPQVAPETSLPARRFSPKVVVKEEVAATQPCQTDEEGYMTVSYSSKRQHSWEPKQSHGAPKMRIVQQQVEAMPPNVDVSPQASTSRAVVVEEQGHRMSTRTVKDRESSSAVCQFGQKVFKVNTGVEVCFLTDSMCLGLEDTISNINAFVHPGTTGSRSLSQNIDHFKKLSGGAIVVIHLGTNDIATGVSPSLLVQHMDSLIHGIQRGREDIHFAVCSVLPRPVDQHNTKALLKQFNALMERKTTQMCNVTFLRTNKYFLSRGEVLCHLFDRDGLHLNLKGKDILFSYFKKFLWHFCRHE